MRTSNRSRQVSSRCSTRRTSSTSTARCLRPSRYAKEGLEFSFRGRSRRSSDSPVSGSATASAVGRDHGDREGAPSLRRDVSRTGGGSGQPGRRRRARAPPDGQPRGDDPARSGLRGHGLEPPGPAVANFEFVRVGDAVAVSDALVRQGVIVRPMGRSGRRTRSVSPPVRRRRSRFSSVPSMPCPCRARSR